MNVLIADDDPVSLLYLRDALEEWGYQVTQATNGTRACEVLLQADAPMLAIIDWMMPGMDGIDVCRAVREHVMDRYTYLIMLTSRTETEFVVEAMNAGADDFVSKPFNVEELQVRVRAGKRIVELEQALRIKATRDALTGIYNRGAIIDLLQKELARHERDQNSTAVIFGDLDHFKQINDRHGHLAGDAVLREVTRRIGAVLRPYDALGRYGGEEILVVLPSCPADKALEVAQRIRTTVFSTPISTEFGPIPVSISLGLAVLDGPQTMSFNELLHLADQALYQAKSNGRNRVEIAARPA